MQADSLSSFLRGPNNQKYDLVTPWYGGYVGAIPQHLQTHDFVPEEYGGA